MIDEVGRRVARALDETQRRAVLADLFEAPDDESDESSGTDGPLAGVPFLVKDLFDVRGLMTRAGSGFLAEARPPADSDSALVRAFRAAGATLAGKTHLYEFACGLTGENPFFGNCANPLAPDRTTGGSSSGSAAAVAAGIVPIAIGTDTGGSVRLPAAHCGLYGYRHIPGHPWIRDAFPLAPSCDAAGWFTASAADMVEVLKTLLKPAETAGTLRGVYLDYGRLDAEVRDACRARAVELIPNDDPETVRELTASFAGATVAYSVLTSIEAAAIHAPWLDTMKDRYSPAVWQRIERGRRWPAAEIREAEAIRTRLVRTLGSYFQTHDVLLLPAAPSPAPRHEECAGYDRTRILDLTAPASLAGLPALTFPLRLANGLSVGLQAILRAPDDPAALRLLRAFDAGAA
ncbi:biuret hydrolase [mine drainage metagenome]|uniref:Biuret hydrolase n=1 Tax=mine drainage metagenome TaxID=410659 RepID=A0A1J5SY27_9ZZZZ